MTANVLGAALVAVSLVLQACTALAVVGDDARHISNAELTSQKVGKVIDARSGAGIPGVQVIVTWRTLSSGISGYHSAGIWCDLQEIVETNADGAFTVPDVANRLDISDRGTRVGTTALGEASQTHEKDYRVTVFKPGYIRVGDGDIVKQQQELAKQHLLSELSLAQTPKVSINAKSVVIEPIALQKVDLPWPDLLAYYARIPLACSDRMAHDNRAPAADRIRASMRQEVRPLACRLDSGTPFDNEAFNAFVGLSEPDGSGARFVARVKALDGLPNPDRIDPLEQITTTAGSLCRAQKEEEHQP